MTKVVNIKKSKYDVYIGRGSKWGNPFRMLNETQEERNRVCELYEQWFIEQPYLIKSLPELKNKVLGCYCKPKRCHGDFLAYIVNNYKEDDIMASIGELIKKKKEIKNISVPEPKVIDMNRPLIMALFAIDVYGKDATDEEIVEVIIGGRSKPLIKQLEKCWDEAKASGKGIKRGKDGLYYADGMLVLQPRTRT